jgi:Domain of unknown function (DUF4410)
MNAGGRWLIGWIAVRCLAGCTTVQSLNQYGGPIPRPDRITEAGGGLPRTFEEMEVGRKVASVFSEHLVAEIRRMGLPAQRAVSPPPPWGRTVMIKGAFLAIDEGNRTERLVIGFGAGRTDVRAAVSVLEVLSQGPRVLEHFEVDAKSGFKPGMAETMGVGAAAGHIATSAILSVGGGAASEAFGTNVEADARRAAKGIAHQLTPFFASKGWIIVQ